MKFAILGGGMVGTTYARAFMEQGHTLVGLCDVQPGATALEVARAGGAALHAAPGGWLGDAEVVVSAVFGTVALPLFDQSLPHLRSGTLYVDMTTATPEDMQACAGRAAGTGTGFVDVAITGAVNLGGARTPLLVAGERAADVQALFAPLGGSVRTVGAQPGDAAALKLLRSIFTKGLEALSVECLATAQAMGLREPLYEVLRDIDETPLRTLMDSMVRTHIPHSGRRRNEVAEAQAQMHQHGLAPIVSPGVEALFARTASATATQPFDGSSTEDALGWLTRHVLARGG